METTINNFDSVVDSAPVSIDIDNYPLFADGKTTQNFTLDLLRNTINENQGYNTPMNGITHADFIDSMSNIFFERGHTPIVKDMFISKNGASKLPGVSFIPQLQTQYGEKSLRAVLVRRLMVVVDIMNFNTNERTTSLVMSYSQDGITTAIGRTIQICRNLCIYGIEHVIHTTGSNRGVSLDKVFQVLGEWATTVGDITNEFDNRLNEMQTREISFPKIQELIGNLSMIRVAKDSGLEIFGSRPSVYPFNNAQINKFAEDVIIKNNENKLNTLYDLYNIGTNLHKPDHMEFVNTIQQNAEWGRLVTDLYLN